MPSIVVPLGESLLRVSGLKKSTLEEQDKKTLIESLGDRFQLVASCSTTRDELPEGESIPKSFKVILNPGRDDWPVSSPTTSKGQSRHLKIEGKFLIIKLTFEFSVDIRPEIESIDLILDDGTQGSVNERMDFSVTVYYSASIKAYGSIEVGANVDSVDLGPRLGTFNRPQGFTGQTLFDVGGGFEASFEDHDTIDFVFKADGTNPKLVLKKTKEEG
jgi:hypothetical protein